MPRRLTSLMGLVAGAAVVAAIVREPLGLAVLLWLACAGALLQAGRRRPPGPAPGPLARAVLRALFPALLMAFVVLTGLAWVVLLATLGRAQGP